MAQHSVRAAALRWGVWYGTIIGMLGVIQIAPGFLAVAANTGTLLAYHRECAGGSVLPSCAVRFAGVVDGIWALFLGTGFAAFVVTLVLYYRAGRRAARESNRISTGIRAALLASALGLLLVTGVNVLVASAGLHPILAVDYGTAAARLEPYVILGLNAAGYVPTLLVAALVGWMGAVTGWRPGAAMRERRPPGLPDPAPYSLLPGAPQPPYPYPYAAATEEDDSSSVPIPSSNGAATE
jgi:hypothetical protein